MGARVANKKRQCTPAEAPLTAYDEIRMKQCMRNNARLQQLGIRTLSNLFASTFITPENKKNNQGDSGSEYNPEEDDTSEGDLRDDNLIPEADALQELESTPPSSMSKDLQYSKKNCNKNTKSTTTKRSATMPPGGIRPRPPRRFLAEAQPQQVQTTRVTRSKKNYANENPMPATCEVNACCSANSDHTQADEVSHQNECHNEDNMGSKHDEQTQNTNGAQGVAQLDLVAATVEQGHNPNGVDQLDKFKQNDIQTDAEAENLQLILGEERIRGDNMGKGLDRMSRSRRAKLPLTIEEGRTRPYNPMIAAKFATECNIAVRNHMPVFKHWKDYKKKPLLLKDYIGKVGARFHMDTDAEPIKKACAKMMKNAQRQQRYRLKRKYFDPYPLHLVTKKSPLKSMTDDQWNELVEGWKDQRKMETCAKNKANRAQLKYPHKTGSRSYEIFCENLGDKYKDEPPTALDLFKECHYSKKKKGYTSTVEAAIAQMETKLTEPVEAGVQPKTVTEVVSEVLAENTKRNSFLQNVGIQPAPTRRSKGDLEAQLAMEKRGSNELREIVDTQRQQLDRLLKQMQEAEAARAKKDEEMTKKQAETDALLRRLMAMIPQTHATV